MMVYPQYRILWTHNLWTYNKNNLLYVYTGKWIVFHKLFLSKMTVSHREYA